MKGGVLNTEQKNLVCCIVTCPHQIEQIFVTVSQGNHLINCGAFYIPPGPSPDIYNYYSSKVDLIAEQFPNSKFTCLETTTNF